MIVKRAEQASKCSVEQVSWELAAALFLTPEAARATPSFWGTREGERTIKLMDEKGKPIGYWRREP